MNQSKSSQEKTPIFLLKTKSVPNDGYEEKFSTVTEGDGLQFDPIFVPVLEHTFLRNGMATVRNLLQKKEIGKYVGQEYGGMIFTSQRAVEAFAKLVEEGKGDPSWPHLQDIPIYTVGPATARALRAIPQSPPLQIFGAETGNGEALAHYILEHYPSWYPDQLPVRPLLFIVGEQRRDIIPNTMMSSRLPEDKKIRVVESVLYGTRVMESFEDDFLRVLKETEERSMRWVVVFSPTGCEAMLKALGILGGEIRWAKEKKLGRTAFIATIGPTTRHHLKDEFGFDADVCAEKPSPEGLLDGIRQFLQNK